MGVFSALTTAVSGMRAQSYALENISGNIANSRTTGFKRLDTSFTDLIPDGPLNRESAGSVISQSRSTNTIQGDIAQSGIDTNIAINGDGFFIVAEGNGGIGANQRFAGSDLYTRRGDFDFDQNGYLRNGAGYFLKGLTIDPVTGNPTSADTGIIRITNDQLAPKITTQIEYAANVPYIPSTTAYTSNTPRIVNSDLLAPAGYTADPRSVPLGTGTVIGSDQTRFLNQSIDGGAVTVYDGLGQPVSLQVRWAKIDNVAGGGTDTWNMFVAENTASTGAAVAWRAVATPFTFNAIGRLTSAPTVALPTLTIGGSTITGVNIVSGSTGISQYGDRDGLIQANSIRQDGYSAGVLNDTSVTSDGKIVGNFSNGQVKTLALLSLARFASPNSLKRKDGGAFEQTLDSGLPLVGSGTATIVGGSLEGSNTDIADEFSKMIVTQQAYSANTRVITTSQDMLQQVLNIIR
jgi:flagellar hook protein FlgE